MKITKKRYKTNKRGKNNSNSRNQKSYRRKKGGAKGTFLDDLKGLKKSSIKDIYKNRLLMTLCHGFSKHELALVLKFYFNQEDESDSTSRKWLFVKSCKSSSEIIL